MVSSNSSSYIVVRAVLSVLGVLLLIFPSLLLSLIFLLFTTASRYPCCPLTLFPGDPPPVLDEALSVVPFSKELVWLPDSHPLSATVTEDSVGPTIPAPPHFLLPLGCFKLRDWRGRRFHYLVGENRLVPRWRQWRLSPPPSCSLSLAYTSLLVLRDHRPRSGWALLLASRLHLRFHLTSVGSRGSCF